MPPLNAYANILYLDIVWVLHKNWGLRQWTLETHLIYCLSEEDSDEADIVYNPREEKMCNE